MRLVPYLLCAALMAPALATGQGVAVDAAYVKQVKDWRARAEQSLRRDDGWLTLAGRYPLKPGENTFGTAPTNDIVFPKGLGPNGMGSIFVEPKSVRVVLVPGYTMKGDDGEFTERTMRTDAEKRDWVRKGAPPSTSSRGTAATSCAWRTTRTRCARLSAAASGTTWTTTTASPRSTCRTRRRARSRS
jgi:hypothetical protein